MGYKKKLILLAVLVISIASFSYVLSASDKYIWFYDTYIFGPYQSLRNKAFFFIPFSIGDIVYLLLGFGLLAGLLKWFFHVATVKKNGDRWLKGVLKLLIGTAAICLLFLIGWGGNYYKKPLNSYWHINTAVSNHDSILVKFDRFLVEQLNIYAPQYHSEPFAAAETNTERYYRMYAGSVSTVRGVHVKPSLFGNLMHYLGIQGYYNPLTGEAQVNSNLPSFMLPFVIAHEMAHQYGIAAEDDANLLAYVLSVKTKDVNSRYSAYFNIWLYTHSMLRSRDTVIANDIKAALNPVSLAHIDTLRALRRKYRGEFSKYSMKTYDSYLKLNNQKDGIESYDKVAISAYLWELSNRRDSIIRIP